MSDKPQNIQYNQKNILDGIKYCLEFEISTFVAIPL